MVSLKFSPFMLSNNYTKFPFKFDSEYNPLLYKQKEVLKKSWQSHNISDAYFNFKTKLNSKGIFVIFKNFFLVISPTSRGNFIITPKFRRNKKQKFIWRCYFVYTHKTLCQFFFFLKLRFIIYVVHIYTKYQDISRWLE